MLKCKNGYFYQILGDIEQYPYFKFNNYAYFTSDVDLTGYLYERNKKSFRNLLKYIISLKTVSLKYSK